MKINFISHDVSHLRKSFVFFTFIIIVVTFWLTKMPGVVAQGLSVVQPLVWTCTPNPIPCGGTAIVTGTITFQRVGPQMPAAVSVTVQLWDDDVGDTHIEDSNTITVQPPRNPRVTDQINQTFTIPVKCTTAAQSCVLQGNGTVAGDSQESAPQCYLYVVGSSVAATPVKLTGGQSKSAYIQCVDFNVAMIELLDTQLAFLPISIETRGEISHILKHLAEEKDAKALLSHVSKLKAVIKTLDVAEEAKGRILQELSSFETGLEPIPEQKEY